MKDEKKKTVAISLSLQDYEDLHDLAADLFRRSDIRLNWRLSRLIVDILQNAIRNNRKSISAIRLIRHQFRNHMYSYGKIKQAFELIRSLEAQTETEIQNITQEV